MNNKVFNEEAYINLCIKLIEKKLEWSNSLSWRHRDYVRLSEYISEQTKVNISVTTLKRLWGKVNYEGNVGPNTLDALSNYLGFRDWMDFKSKNHELLEKNESLGELNSQQHVISKKTINYRLIIILITAVSILSFLLYFFIQIKEDYIDNDYVFTCQNPIGTVPYSVKFTFDVSKIKSDSIFIIAGDQQRKHLITKENNFLTRIYFIPGSKKAKLIVNNKILKEMELFAGTDDWLGCITQKDNLHPVFIHDVIKDGTLFISASQLTANQIDYGQTYMANYYYTKRFNIDADNISYKIRIKNNIGAGKDVCQRTNIGIMASKGFMTIPMINEGCLALAKLYLSEIYVNGWTNDLSVFAREMNDWHDLFVKVVNKKVSIYIDNTLVYETAYTKPLGEFLGFRFEFSNSCGTVDYVKVLNEKGELVFNDDFTRQRE